MPREAESKIFLKRSSLSRSASSDCLRSVMFSKTATISPEGSL